MQDSDSLCALENNCGERSYAGRVRDHRNDSFVWKNTYSIGRPWLILAKSRAKVELCRVVDLDGHRRFYRECFAIEHIGKNVVESEIVVRSGYSERENW